MSDASDTSQVSRRSANASGTKTIVPVKGIVYPIPVLDEKGKPVEQTVKFRGRDVKSPAYDHTFLHAGKAVPVPSAVADYLIGEKLAREADPVIDEVVLGNPLAHEPWLRTGATKTDNVMGNPIEQDPLADD